MFAKVEVLGIAVSNRYGVELEWAFAHHDSVAIYSWYMINESRGIHAFIRFDDSFPDYDTKTNAGGIDAQYRRYLFRVNGAEGVFIAPGLEVQHFITSTLTRPPMDGSPQLGLARQEWTYVGASADVGGQVILPLGLVLSASLGLQYREALGTIDVLHYPFDWGVVNGPGLRPRLRLSVGWAFL